jgi:hypothetical protein
VAPAGAATSDTEGQTTAQQRIVPAAPRAYRFLQSPARVEIIDPLSTPLNLPFGSAWRPWEALEPQISDAMIRQLNQFTGASPIADGAGAHRAMDLTIDTGDSADSRAVTRRPALLISGDLPSPVGG